MQTIEEQILALESKKSGDFFEDILIDEKIHYLKKSLKGEERIVACTIGDEGCISCGS